MTISVSDCNENNPAVKSKIFGNFNLICLFVLNRNSRPEVFFKKGFLKNFAKFTGKHLRQTLFFLIKLQAKVAGFSYKDKDSGAGVFLYICEISRNAFSYRTPLVAASV